MRAEINAPLMRDARSLIGSTEGGSGTDATRFGRKTTATGEAFRHQDPIRRSSEQMGKAPERTGNQSCVGLDKAVREAKFIAFRQTTNRDDPPPWAKIGGRPLSSAHRAEQPLPAWDLQGDPPSRFVPGHTRTRPLLGTASQSGG